LTGLISQAIDDPAATRQMGQRAKARAREFTWERNAEATERFCIGLQRHARQAAGPGGATPR
jgi:glycosyltransferase involved in cell wall biosynthesis